MPIYTIKCKACGFEEDKQMTWEEKEELIKKKCPECGKKKRFNRINNVTVQLSRGFRRGLA